MNIFQFTSQNSSLKRADLIINGSPFPDEVIYENLLPYAVENGSGLALSHTCKAMHQIMTIFLHNNATKIFAAAMSNTSRLYRSIRTWALCPLDTPAKYHPLNGPAIHYIFNASIVKSLKALGLSYPTQRVLYPEEILSLSQPVEMMENEVLERIWPSLILKVREKHPNLNMNPEMTASDIQTWMYNNSELLEEIQDLDLSNLDLKVLPREIANFKNLTRLDLSLNKLTTLPREITFLKNLRRLDLSANSLKPVPIEIGLCTNLRELSLSINQLSTLLPEIGQLTNLETLDLDYNQLSTLPSEIALLTHLVTLGLGNNQFSVFSPVIGQLKNLENLELRHNQLSTLPPGIGLLKNLQRLYLEDNQLTELPPEIGQLTKLYAMRLTGNPITTLPPELDQLTELTILKK